MSTKPDRLVTKTVLGENVSYYPKVVMEAIIKKLGKQKELSFREVNFWRSTTKLILQEQQIKVNTAVVNTLAKKLAKNISAKKVYARFSQSETETLGEMELWTQAVHEVYRREGYTVDARAILAGFLAGHTVSVQLLVAADIIRVDPSG